MSEIPTPEIQNNQSLIFTQFGFQTPESSTVNVQKRNVRFDKPNKILFGLKSLGYPKRLITKHNRFQTGLELVWNQFVWFSDVRFGQPNQKKFNFQNLNVPISDVYCTY